MTNNQNDEGRSMKKTIDYADRYTALGITPNGCKDQCEGTGVVPIYMSEGDHRAVTPTSARVADEDDPKYVAAWREAESTARASDGWHFVRCPSCSP